MPSHTVIYRYIPLHAVACRCRHMPPHAVTCRHTPSHAVTCRHTPSRRRSLPTARRPPSRGRASLRAASARRRRGRTTGLPARAARGAARRSFERNWALSAEGAVFSVGRVRIVVSEPRAKGESRSRAQHARPPMKKLRARGWEGEQSARGWVPAATRRLVERRRQHGPSTHEQARAGVADSASGPRACTFGRGS